MTTGAGSRFVWGFAMCEVCNRPQAKAVVCQRGCGPYVSVEDLARRVPNSAATTLPCWRPLARSINLGTNAKLHRRDALWQVEKAARKNGPLLEGIVEIDSVSPLRRMDVEERLVADYHGTGLTTGHHPMAYRRDVLRGMGVKSARELKNLPHGKEATVAGCVITRQRPGTAKGIIFMTLEDETGTSRVIISPDFYDKNRMAVLKERFVLVSGLVQNQDDVVHLKARSIQPLTISAATTPSHDFH